MLVCIWDVHSERVEGKELLRFDSDADLPVVGDSITIRDQKWLVVDRMDILATVDLVVERK